MFHSGIQASEMIADITSEVDVALPIENRRYTQWLNTVEQMLYTEVIKEQHEAVFDMPSGGLIDLSEADIVEYEQDKLRYDDVYTVFCGDTQLIRSTLTSGRIFPDTYYRDNDALHINSEAGDEVRVIYLIRPALKGVDANDNVKSGEVMLPPEWCEMVSARLRGEAYRIMNENVLAANWLAEYNALLENFKIWIANRMPQFGI